MNDGVLQNTVADASAAAPASPPRAPSSRANPVVVALGRYFSPLSALSLVAVLIVFVVCVALWDIPWLRPYVAAGGAGLAAFLGPIPGIISPDARSKWLASVVVAALITIGSWFATRDISERLELAEHDGLVARATIEAHDKFVAETLSRLPEQAKVGLFSVAPRKLWALFNTDKDYDTLLDMSLMLLQVERENGHGLYYAGEAYAKLGKTPQMIRMFQHYVAEAVDHPDAKTGSAGECYKRTHGFCAERLGWVLHILANTYLSEAAQLADSNKPKKLSDAFDYEKRNLDLVKWPDDQHNPGFDEDKGANLRSSCDILQGVAKERVRLSLASAAVINVGKAKLGDACGAWPATGP